MARWRRRGRRNVGGGRARRVTMARAPRGWHRIGDNHFVRGDARAHTHIVKEDGAGWIYQCYGPSQHVPLANRGPYATPRPAFKDAKTVERIVRRAPPVLGHGGANKFTHADAQAVFARHGEDIAGLDADARQKAYRRIVFAIHPDRRSDAETAQATRDLVELNAALAALGGVDAPRAARRRPARPAPGTAWRPVRPIGASGPTWTHDVDGSTTTWKSRGRPIPRAEALDWIEQTFAHAFVRVQSREYAPHDPRDTLFSGFRDVGYSGRVVSTRTLKQAELDPGPFLELLLAGIARTAPSWEGDPLELITQLTIQAPIGRNVGHAAVAWQAPQDEVARDFGFRTRYYSISFAPRPVRKKAVPKAQRLDRHKVESILRDAGMKKINPRAWKVSKWQFEGALFRSTSSYDGRTYTRTPTIETKDRHVDGVYYGQLTREKLDAMINKARGNVETS